MRIRIALIAILLLTLCGCAGDTVDSSLRVPELPAEFVEFNDEINNIKNEGYELVSPNGGTNRQSVQLTDLDNDGVDEGVAFFRELGNTYKVYAYVFKKSEDGYSVAAKIEGSGDTVENAAYADVLGNGNNELIIGWSMSDSGAKSVGVYSVNENDAIKLCEVNSIYHIVCDLNNDMVSDLCVIYEDPADGLQKLALYSEYEGSVLFRASAPLSANSESILRIRAGYIDDAQPAVFVEKRYMAAGVITDVIVWKNVFLKNLTYSETAAMSEGTARINEIYVEDVDWDGALEVPMPTAPTTAFTTIEGEVLPGILWYGFGESGGKLIKAYTFRRTAEKWSISLPLDWNGKCTAVYHKNPVANVTTFYSYKEEGLGDELFNIIAITGENREKNLEKLGYDKLLEQNGILYGVQIKKKRFSGYDITPEMLAERFSYHDVEWSTGEVVF